MRRALIFVIVVVLVVITVYQVDRRVYMKARVKKDTWVWGNGHKFGDIIKPEAFEFSEDTLVLKKGQKALLRYQYYDFLILEDPATHKTGTYERLGSIWSTHRSADEVGH